MQKPETGAKRKTVLIKKSKTFKIRQQQFPGSPKLKVQSMGKTELKTGDW